MKLNKLFHWLYFGVMALPLVVAPIFAIYSHRHTLTEQTQVDIQYKFQTNDISNMNNIVNGNIYTIDLSYNNQSLNNYFSDYDFLYFNFIHFEYNNEIYYYISDTTQQFYLSNSGDFYIGNDRDSGSIYIPSSTVDVVTNWYDIGQDLIACGVKLSNCDFNVIESVDVQDINNDIMSVFVNNYANAIDKYFNYDNVVNFGTLYTWLNTTFFSGSAPLGFFIFWHLLEYWLLTSLLWLLFDVLIYVPMLVHRWLDKASLS